MSPRTWLEVARKARNEFLRLQFVWQPREVLSVWESLCIVYGKHHFPIRLEGSWFHTLFSICRQYSKNVLPPNVLFHGCTRQKFLFRIFSLTIIRCHDCANVCKMLRYVSLIPRRMHMLLGSQMFSNCDSAPPCFATERSAFRNYKSRLASDAEEMLPREPNRP